MNKYEFTFLLSDEKEVEPIRKLLESLEGKIITEKSWGKRSLSYPINKQTSALYYTWVVDVKPKSVMEIKRKLNFNDQLLRYLLLKVE